MVYSTILVLFRVLLRRAKLSLVAVLVVDATKLRPLFIMKFPPSGRWTLVLSAKHVSALGTMLVVVSFSRNSSGYFDFKRNTLRNASNMRNNGWPINNCAQKNDASDQMLPRLPQWLLLRLQWCTAPVKVSLLTQLFHRWIGNIWIAMIPVPYLWTRAIVASTMIDFYGVRLRMYPRLHHQNLLLYYLLSLPPSFLQTSHQVYQSTLQEHKHSIA